MSTQRGNANRSRAQKYKNRTVFKNDLHDKTDLQKRLNAMNVNEVCLHCKSVIEWKIKYKKYKPLSQPKTCVRCQQKNIKKAYHIYCRVCARDAHVCAKCGKSEEEVEIEPSEPSAEEQQVLKAEIDRLLNFFPERKRRTILRYMQKGKEVENSNDKSVNGGNTTDDDIKSASVVKRRPYSRDELLEKIDKLKLNEKDRSNFDFSSDSEDCDDSSEEEIDN